MIRIKQNNKRGFTLLELLITIAIVAILAAVAVPIFLTYLERGKVAEAMQEADAARVAVSDCYQRTSDMAQCDSNAKVGFTQTAGEYHSGAAVGTVPLAGTITVSMTAAAGTNLSGLTYTLEPTVSDNKITWTAGGGVCGLSYITC